MYLVFTTPQTPYRFWDPLNVLFSLDPRDHTKVFLSVIGCKIISADLFEVSKFLVHHLVADRVIKSHGYTHHFY